MTSFSRLKMLLSGHLQGDSAPPKPRFLISALMTGHNRRLFRLFQTNHVM
jgi:hypothetical protein